jgi:N-acetyl-anhydromuramyl-L-alanine amidase AmpD
VLQIDNQGRVQHPRVRHAIKPNIERGAMTRVRGIIVHQTDSPTAQATLNSYSNPKVSGAHFLIDKDGAIYQTASVHKQTWHVGRLRARCLAELRCPPAELQALKKFNPSGESQREMKKSAPDRYPANKDSIGIEIVGEALPRNVPRDERVYETVNAQQNEALKWLVHELTMTLRVAMSEIHRHPIVSYKNPTEAATAQW